MQRKINLERFFKTTSGRGGGGRGGGCRGGREGGRCDKQNKIRREKHTWFGAHGRPVMQKDFRSQEKLVEIEI